MEKLVFKDKIAFNEWIDDNELFDCYYGSKFIGHILGTEADTLRIDNIVRVHVGYFSGKPTAYINVELTPKQIEYFKEAHCVELEITSYLLETVAIIGQTIGQKLYDKNNDTFGVAQDIIHFARKFEKKNKWFLHGYTDRYIDDLDEYCEEVLKDY